MKIWGYSSMILFIVNLWNVVVSFTCQLLYPQKNVPSIGVAMWVTEPGRALWREENPLS
jgi:hypothetical protein